MRRRPPNKVKKTKTPPDPQQTQTPGPFRKDLPAKDESDASAENKSVANGRLGNDKRRKNGPWERKMFLGERKVHYTKKKHHMTV